MNGWIDVAAVLVAGTIATVLALKEVGWKRRYRELEVHLSLAQKERDALKSQVGTLSKDNLMLIDRMHGIEAERDGLRAQLANGNAAPRKRASRAKPTATQEEEQS